MIYQKPKQFKGIINDDINRSFDRDIYNIDDFTYEYNKDKINFSIKYDYEQHQQKVQIDYNFTQTQKVRRRKYGRTENRKTKYASQLVDFYLVPFAQNILKSTYFKCNWDVFGGYSNFRDNYYDDGYHYQSRFLAQISHIYSGCECNYGDNSLKIGQKLQIVDLMPGDCDLTIIYSEKPGYYKIEQSKFPQFISVDYNQEYYQAMEIYKVNRCMCPVFIKVIEKSENIMYRILILLKAIKNQSPEYYNYLKSLRKDKLLEILSQKYSNLSELIEKTSNHVPKNLDQQTQKKQQFGIEYMQQQQKLKEDQQKHKKERQGPLGKIIQLYDKYYNEQEDEDFNYEQQLQKEYPNHQQQNQEQIIQEEEQENTEKNKQKQPQDLEQQQKPQENQIDNQEEKGTNKIYEPFIYQQDDNLFQQFTNEDEFNGEEEEDEEEQDDTSIDYNKDQYEDLESLKSENELEDLMLDSEFDEEEDDENSEQNDQQYQPQQQIQQQQENLEHLSKQNKLQEKQIQWLLNYANNLQQQQQTQNESQQQLQLQISDTNNSNQYQNNNNKNYNIKRSLKQLYDDNYEGMQDYFNYHEDQGILQLQNKKICSQKQQQQQQLLS